MTEIREVGARIRLIPHGDVSAALVGGDRGLARSTSCSASAARPRACWPRRRSSAPAARSSAGCGRARTRSANAALEAGYDLDEVLDKDRLVSGNDVFFAATGVTDGEMLDGRALTSATRRRATESVSMRSRSGTVRRISARHDRAKLREITGERLG